MFKALFTAKKKDNAFAEMEKKYTVSNIVLGKGTYAEVRKGVMKERQLPVAIKLIDKGGLTAKELAGLQREVTILRNLEHPNVVKFYDFYEGSDVMAIVMEFVGGGQLLDKILKEENNFSEEDARKVIRNLAEALQHCYKNGVIHRDIKPQNILLTTEREGSEVKLADFNLSIQLDPATINFSVVQTMCGTPNYVAPEILSRHPYDYKCDIWSLGVIAYVILSGGYVPFPVEQEGDDGKKALLEKVRRGKWRFMPANVWDNVSLEAKDFLTHVMEKDPEKRYDYGRVLNHPWLVLPNDSTRKFDKHRIDMTDARKEYFRRQIIGSAVMKLSLIYMQEIMKGNDSESSTDFEEDVTSSEFGMHSGNVYNGIF